MITEKRKQQEQYSYVVHSIVPCNKMILLFREDGAFRNEQ